MVRFSIVPKSVFVWMIIYKAGSLVKFSHQCVIRMSTGHNGIVSDVLVKIEQFLRKGVYQLGSIITDSVLLEVGSVHVT